MRRHLSDASWLFSADIGSRALNFLAVAWLARTLEPALYGLVVIGAAVLDYALLLCDWGLKTLGTRETARPAEVRRFQPRTIVLARLELSLIIFVTAQLILVIAPVDPAQASIIRIYLLGLLPYALLVDWYHQGRGAFAVITAGRVVGSMLLAVAAFTLVGSPADTALVPWLYVGSMTATSLLLIGAAAAGARDTLKRSTDLGPRERLVPRLADLATTPAVLRASTALGVAALFGQTFIVLPTIVAGQLLGTTEAGLLNAALRIVMIALIVDRVFGAIYLPALTRVWESDRERAGDRLDAAFRVVVALGVCASVVCMIFAGDLVRLAFGERYAAAGPVLIVLAPFVAATLVNTFFAYGLIAIGEEQSYLRSGIVSGAIFVALLLAATPLLGLEGVALSMVIGESVMTVLLFRAFRRHIRLRPLRPLAVSIGVGALLLAASRALDAGALWQAPLYAAAFAGAVGLLGGVRLEDMRTQPR